MMIIGQIWIFPDLCYVVSNRSDENISKDSHVSWKNINRDGFTPQMISHYDHKQTIVIHNCWVNQYQIKTIHPKVKLHLPLRVQSFDDSFVWSPTFPTTIFTFLATTEQSTLFFCGDKSSSRLWGMAVQTFGLLTCPHKYRICIVHVQIFYMVAIKKQRAKEEDTRACLLLKLRPALWLSWVLVKWHRILSMGHLPSPTSSVDYPGYTEC